MTCWYSNAIIRELKQWEDDRHMTTTKDAEQRLRIQLRWTCKVPWELLDWQGEPTPLGERLLRELAQ